MRLNLGCGAYPIRGFTNIDADPKLNPDVVANVPPLRYPDNEVEEIYCGHFLEHQTREAATELLAECYRVLRPGGTLGVVVPDTREIMRRYIEGEETVIEVPEGRFWNMSNLDDVCSVFLYSVIQDTPHLWSYDEVTLCRALQAAGFRVMRKIDRYHDPRLGTGRWYQMGFDSIKPYEAS